MKLYAKTYVINGEAINERITIKFSSTFISRFVHLERCFNASNGRNLDVKLITSARGIQIQQVRELGNVQILVMKDSLHIGVTNK